jgi:hypothetical protein
VNFGFLKFTAKYTKFTQLTRPERNTSLASGFRPSTSLEDRLGGSHSLTPNWLIFKDLLYDAMP